MVPMMRLASATSTGWLWLCSFATGRDYDASGDIPGTAIDDPPLPHPNDSGVLASLHVDERVLTEDFLMIVITPSPGLDDEHTGLSTEAVTPPRFPLQFTPSLQDIHIPRCRALPFTSSSRKGCAVRSPSFTAMCWHSTLRLTMLSTFFEMAGSKAYSHTSFKLLHDLNAISNTIKRRQGARYKPIRSRPKRHHSSQQGPAMGEESKEG
ncbi:uncharacterized protein HD556DRAFT_1311911 [Suillus plorans]|uniref:Uncharacterized protein n=1 Tax=Suillus plorans TaxID=116603 RepID=A0A9P7AHL7_9AGAM|nr:uncharacterized protein HD556DRAFT_1311911 [Suillus plorans]KAG1788652.1 hypothetical protein HD556DRAFT_1311911 [Suillus plorans]